MYHLCVVLFIKSNPDQYSTWWQRKYAYLLYSIKHELNIWNYDLRVCFWPGRFTTAPSPHMYKHGCHPFLGCKYQLENKVIIICVDSFWDIYKLSTIKQNGNHRLRGSGGEIEEHCPTNIYPQKGIGTWHKNNAITWVVWWRMAGVIRCLAKEAHH